ncbi:MAG: SdiA-regulated domain-containing protein [Gemmatimonadales bacterium]
MTNVRRVALLIGVAAIASACRSKAEVAKAEAAELAAREHRLSAKLTKVSPADLAHDEPVAKWIMSPELKEISGIALKANGNLLAHDDENARIYEIDPRRGVVIKRFDLGADPLHGDFEGITIAGTDVYLLASNGKLYQFKEGPNGARVPYKLHDTHLGKECEFEGVAFEPDSAWLVLPCKTVLKKNMRGQLVIYRWKLDGADSTRISILAIPMDEVIGSNKWKTFRPSDITIDPESGDYVMVGSQEKGLVEIDTSGQVIRSERLPAHHAQPEGVAITNDGILIVSDEASTKPAAITLYRWRQ